MRILLVLILVSWQARADAPRVVLAESERLQLMSGRIASEEFQSKLDVISRSRRTTGNAALLLLNGKMSFPVRYRLIDLARESIVLTTFSIFAGGNGDEIKDPSTRLLVQKLIAAKERGVDVKVLIDGFAAPLTGAKTAVNQLRRAGIKVVKYNPVVHQDFELNWFLGLPHFLYRLAAVQNPTSNRWHEKTLVVDGKYGVIGGLNWGEHYKDGNNLTSYLHDVSTFYEHPLVRELGIPPRDDWGKSDPDAWRDTDLLIKGPVVRVMLRRLLTDLALLELLRARPRRNEYRNASVEDWERAALSVAHRWPRLDTTDGDAGYDWKVIAQDGLVARYVTQRPFLDRKLTEQSTSMREFAHRNDLYVYEDNPLVGISNLYVNLIRNAERQILWGCHSNRPPDDVLAALVDAANRGVEVYLIANSRQAARTLPDRGAMMYDKGARYYDELLRRGGGNIRLFEWQRELRVSDQVLRSGAFHSKVFSVDGVVTSVGAFNVARASFRKHAEGTLVIIDPDFARHAEQMFQDDLQFTKEVTSSEPHSRRAHHRR